MSRKIVVIQGHPDPSGERLCHALGAAYASAARAHGHDVQTVDVARLEFALLRTADDWHTGIAGTPAALREAQAGCMAAGHLVVIYPLWMGTMPALLKGFIEQVFRPGVALSYGDGYPKPLLGSTSARIIVTMGMPALAYRWYFFSHGLKNLERSILGVAGVRPVRSTLFGMVDRADADTRAAWINKVVKLGARAA